MCSRLMMMSFFFFQAEDGIRDGRVTGVQTCALPISRGRVALRIGVVPSLWRERGANEVQVEAAVAPFQVEENDGRLVAGSSAPPEVGELLAGLAPSPEVWRKLEIEGGPDGILARRPVTAHPQGYVYDLC